MGYLIDQRNKIGNLSNFLFFTLHMFSSLTLSRIYNIFLGYLPITYLLYK